MFKRYVLLAIGVAVLHGIMYFVIFMTWALGIFKGHVGVFFEIFEIILEIPLVFLIRFLAPHVRAIADFFRMAQHWCGDNSNILPVGIAACNSLFWGMAIAWLIYRHKRRLIIKDSAH